MLDNQGISYTTQADAVEAGYAVCVARDSGVSEIDTAMIVMNNSNLTAYDAGFFVGAAEVSLCPWFYEGGEQPEEFVA